MREHSKNVHKIAPPEIEYPIGPEHIHKLRDELPIAELPTSSPV